MKKLVTLACALVAASAFAVESANTVGYTTQAIAADTYYMIGVQFETVGGGAITFDNLITMSGVLAYDDGDDDCAEIQFFTGSGYNHYYYITDAWDANDEPLNKDAWAFDGYECEGTSVPAGKSFWIKSNDAGSITFSL
jgi:hypothetical protein